MLIRKVKYEDIEPIAYINVKIGIITDIHSNIYALNAVLNKLDEEKVDKIICCGDIIGIGANPEKTVQALISRKDKLITVRGNHEQYLLEGLPKKVHDDKRLMSSNEIKNHEWTHKQLSDSSKNFIRKMRISEIIQIQNKKIYLVHYPLNVKNIKNPTAQQNKEMFKEIDADIFLYGHTHTTSINQNDNKWYINPGSLGCPGKSNIANAGILYIDEKEVHYKHLQVEYDARKAILEIEKLKFPFYKQILEIFYGEK